MQTWRWISLLLLGLLVAGLGSIWIQAPGYMDADYYFATGQELSRGRGFVEPFIWNYLDDPSGLPHPSHLYWLRQDTPPLFGPFLHPQPVKRSAQPPIWNVRPASWTRSCPRLPGWSQAPTNHPLLWQNGSPHLTGKGPSWKDRPCPARFLLSLYAPLKAVEQEFVI